MNAQYPCIRRYMADAKVYFSTLGTAYLAGRKTGFHGQILLCIAFSYANFPKALAYFINKTLVFVILHITK